MRFDKSFLFQFSHVSPIMLVYVHRITEFFSVKAIYCLRPTEGVGKTGAIKPEDLETKMQGINEKWEQLEANLVVGVPAAWVQAWVAASVNQTLGDVGPDGMSQDTALTLKAKIFLPAPGDVHAMDPSADNAQLDY